MYRSLFHSLNKIPSWCAVVGVAGLILTSASAAQSHYWNHSNSGDWTNGSMWTPNSAPNGPTHWAAMGVSSATPYTITMDADIVLEQLELVAGNATLSAVGRNITVDTLTQIGPGGGTTLLLAGSSWLGAGSFRSEALLNAQGSSTIQNLIQTGQLRVIGDSSYGHATLTLEGDANNSGTIEMFSNNGTYSDKIVMAGGGLLTNSGTFHSMPGTSGGARIFDGAMLNQGTVWINQDTTFQTGPITHTQNKIQVGAGSTLTLASGTDYTQTAGDLDVLGSFDMLSGNFTFDGGTTTSNRPRLLSSNLSIDPSHTDAGHFQIEGVSTFDGNLWPLQSVLLRGSTYGGHHTTTITSGHTNAGLWQLESQNGTYGVTLVQTPGTQFINNATMEFLVGANGVRAFNGDFSNGTSGSIRHELHTTFAIGPFVNQGSWVIEPAADLRIANQTEFTQETGTLDVQGEFLHDSGIDRWNGGTTSGTPKLTHSELHLNGNDAAIYDLIMRGNSSLVGDIGSNGKLQVHGDNYGSHTTLSIAAPVTNRGAMVFESSTGAYASNLDSTGTTFTNEGSFQVLPGAGGARNMNGGFTNTGTVDLQYATTFGSGTAQNDGQWTIQDGVTMTVASTSTLIQNSGTLDIVGALVHTSGVDRLLGGTVNGSPHFVSSALEFGPGFTTPFEGVVGGTSTLTGAPAVGQTLLLRGATVGTHSTLDLTESVSNEGTFEMTSLNAAYHETLNTGAFTFTNAGTFQTTTGSSGNRNINGSFHNTGIVDLAHHAYFSLGPIVNSGDWTVQTDQLQTINSGTLFEMDGGSLTVDGDFLHLSGTDRLLAGTINGSPRFRGNSLEFGAGLTTTDALRAESSCTLDSDIPATANLMIVGASGGNSATLSLSVPSTVAGNLEMTTENAAHSTTLNATGGNDLTLTGSLTISQGTAGNRIINGALDNQGTVSVGRVTSLNTGPLTNQGSFTVDAGSTFTVNGGVDFEQAGGTLNVNGEFIQLGGNALFSGGAVNGIPFLRACNTEFTPSFTSPGTIQLQGVGTFAGAVATDQVLEFIGNSVGSHHTTTVATGLTNSGTMRMNSENAGYSVTLNVSGGPFVNEGAFEVLQGTAGNRIMNLELDNRGNMDFFRTTSLNGAGLNHVNSGTLTNQVGTLTVTGDSFTNQAGGRVDGVGTLTFAGVTSGAQNDGTWAPGMSAGLMTLNGNWTQGSGGNLEIEAGGLVQDTEYDHLHVSGTATLDGTISLSSIDGFVPQFGQQFTVLTAGTVTGTFSNVSFAGDIQLGYTVDVIYNATSVVAQVVQRVNLAGEDLTALRLTDPVPGVAGQNNLVQIDGATGFGQVVLVWGFTAGLTPVPGCSGLDFGIQSPKIGDQVPASATGTALIAVFVPSSASGVPVLLQALDVNRCMLSEVNGFTFP